MAEPKKDTIYIDIDDEITGIIDKVRGSKGQVTALVLPKRAGVFQSIVNMKLLKRAADEAGKKLVLITNEAGLLPLAGAAGIYIAKTLTSKPEIPMAPKMDDAGEEAIDEAGNTQLAATTAAATSQPPVDNGVETLELDDDELPADAAAAAAPIKKETPPAKTPKPKSKKDSSGFSIPNFSKFRKKLIFGGIILLLLIIGIVLAAIVLPKAVITIKTDAQNVPVEMNLNLSTTATELDDSSDTPTLPAKLASEQRTYSQQVPTTGQQNHGNKASGQVTVTNCAHQDGAVTIPAGTAFSGGNNTYVSQQSVTLPSSTFTGGGNCTNNSKATVNIIAQSGGSSYNLPAGSGFSISNAPSGVTGQGGTISGGTDNIVKVVNQNDINTAMNKISTNNNVEKEGLKDKLKKDGYFAILSTFSSGTPNTTQSAQVGDVANSVTVTQVITYTMLGAKEDDLNTVVDNNVKNQVDTSKQVILDRGLDKAVFGVNTSNSNGAQLTMQTTAEVGPDLDIQAIRQSALGKKPADVRGEIESNPDVISVNVKLSPFWVSSVPKKESKVKVVIAKPTTTKSSNDAGSQ